MATPDDIDAELTLEIDGQNVTPEKFLKGVRAFFGVLSSITKDTCEVDQPVKWLVQVKAGSNLVGIQPAAGASANIVAAITGRVLSSIKALENGADDLEDLPEAGLRHLRDLGAVVGLKEGDDTTVRVWRRKEPVGLSHKTVATAVDLLRAEYEDHGSIEGTLEMATVRGSQHFVIYEPVSNRPFRCYVGDDQFEQALSCFRKRVEVYGMIRYRADGSPTSIKVEEIVPFPDPEQLPHFREVRGILRNFE